MGEKITYADKPWTKVYFLGQYKLKKSFMPYPNAPIHTILDEAAEDFPGNVACICSGAQITYQDLKLHSDTLATALADLGVKKGDRVATILPNCIQSLVANFGILRTGAVHVPCNPDLGVDDLEYLVSFTGARTVICIDDRLDIVQRIVQRSGLDNVIVTWRTDYAAEPVEQGDIPGARKLADLINEYEADPPEVEIDPREDLAMIYSTGGTTGRPKGVMMTHYGRWASIMIGWPWVFEPLKLAVRGKASILVAAPCSHLMGHMMVEASVHMGLRILLVSDPSNADEIIALMKKYRPLVFPAYPSQLMRMLPKMSRTQTMVLAAGAHLPRQLAEDWKRVTGMVVSQQYGLTEGGCTFNLSAFSKITGFMPYEKPGLGVPAPDIEVKLVDPETHEEIPVGEVGEVWFRGPNLMKGYWPTPGDGLVDGWLHTGDLARMDEDGYFYMADRVKDTINVFGNLVYSTEVDDALSSHPAVVQGVAIGIPDLERRGSEKVKAFVELKEEFRGKVTAEHIIEHCRQKLPPYAVPAKVEFRDYLPETATHKVFKKALREEERRKMEAEAK